MKKLINLTVYDAKNMICVWNEKNPDEGWECGIALDDADCGFMIPRYYVVGVYDDGSSAAAGIFDLTDINQSADELDNDLFLYNEFAHKVDIYAARAFVNHERGNSGCSEREVKDTVFELLLKSGVEIDNDARKYLANYPI